MAMPFRNRLPAILLTGSVAVVAGGIAFGLYVAKASLDAERTHQLYRLVLISLNQYIQDNSGRWPRDWNDLAPVSSTKESASELWDSLDEVKRRVFVDFSATVADVGEMEVEGFSVVKPIGPNYGPHEGAIRELIDVARRESQK